MRDSKFKKGDAVWSCRYGWGEVTKVDFVNGGDHPIQVKFPACSNVLCFTADGKIALKYGVELFFYGIGTEVMDKLSSRADARVKDGDSYFFISLKSDGTYIECKKDLRFDEDSNRYSARNYFKTLSEATEYAEKIEELLRSRPNGKNEI